MDKLIPRLLVSWRDMFRTSRGPAKSIMSNLSCRAKRTSTTGSSLATALVLSAILGNLLVGRLGRRWERGVLCAWVQINCSV